ncbi:hypothetical protein CAEBREN_19709 [Caenorhabditis brenneri]|uniref:Serpentine Receptor, class Z n=1 Tax=Caenorhabditis brenneri TaxID=135651 RepID=G0MDU7_CAEBE|nr:hypothetical protein CAEBREN_19709 [Caenorhabditis brenneri]
MFGMIGYNASGESILGESVDNAIDYYASFSVVFMAIFSLLISPFYIYVYKTNRERDKNSAVFPIVDHFYKMLKTSLAIFFFFVVFYVIGSSYDLFYPDLDASFIIGMALGALGFIFLISFTEVFQLLLSLLAIKKFLIYFDESTERYVIISRKSLRILTYSFYLVYTIKNIFRLFLFVATLPGYPYERWGGTIWKISIVTDVSFFEFCFIADQSEIQCLTVFTNLLVIFTSLLYIPMLISINKFSHLRSVQESKPQKYILMQTMTVLVYKMLFHAPVTTYCFITGRLEYLSMSTNVFDVFCVPAIIEISYLFCNRHNLKTLLNSWKNKNLFAKLMTRDRSAVITVQPRHAY